MVGEGRRYAIENCLLDPLLLGATVIRQNSKYGGELGIPDNVPYAKLEGLDRERLQDLANIVQAKVLGLTLEEVGSGQSFLCNYRNGYGVRVLEEYAGMPGHTLVECAKAAFRCLERFRSADDLLSHIIQQVMRDLPGLAPDDIFEVLVSLCEREIE